MIITPSADMHHPTRALPESLRPLGEIAHNFWWTWTPRAAALFERLDPARWVSSSRNPVAVLEDIPDDRLHAASADAAFLREVTDTHAALQKHLADPAWFGGVKNAVAATNAPEFLAAYFCAEFGITECFQIYSGGLGLLAGDHLKSASELGLPLVAVGLLYRNGYFHQKFDEAGTQQEEFPPLNPSRQPVSRVRDMTGHQLRVYIDLPGRTVACAVWRADVGRTRLYLLDTNLDENRAEDREITANLYLGDQNRRIQQEIVLGIGGVRALRAVGEKPTVFHMNEGHAAFMALERIRVLRQEHPNLSFDQIREAASAAHVFTTHTPVPAGIDRFPPGLISHYFSHFHETLGLDLEGLLALGREDVTDRGEAFSMAVLAIRTSKWANGVSRLHGRVSRRMWRDIWPGTSEHDVPIGHVTNGIHTATWVDPDMAALFDKALGESWRARPQDAASWSRTKDISDADLWAARTKARARLCEFVKVRGTHAAAKSATLDPAHLTIGFARRFAGYKRGTLLLRDPARLERLLTHPERPVQFVFAGKSHPGDGWGKDLIREVVEFARSPRAGGRIVFLEDYDIRVAQAMVRGCDVWLNNPIRGLEASGTSGMKAALNGVLNASIKDGWWDEAFDPSVGFAIDDLGTYPSDAANEERENFEAEALYRLLEQRIAPEFYDRAKSGPPAKWLARVKSCIAGLAPTFSTGRMVAEYAQSFYFPAHNAAALLAADGLRGGREISDHVMNLRSHWSKVRVRSVFGELIAGKGLVINAVVCLGGLKPADVLVQSLLGTIDPASGGAALGEDARPHRMTHKAALADDSHHYTCTIPYPPAPGAAGSAGAAVTNMPRGFQARVLPGDERHVTPFIPGLIVSGAVHHMPAAH